MNLVDLLHLLNLSRPFELVQVFRLKVVNEDSLALSPVLRHP